MKAYKVPHKLSITAVEYSMDYFGMGVSYDMRHTVLDWGQPGVNMRINVQSSILSGLYVFGSTYRKRIANVRHCDVYPD